MHVFNFNYLDFPGSFIAGDTGSQEFDIQDEVEKTHSLVVLIDGLSVLRRIKKIDDDGPNIYDDIDSMIDLISRCARRPIQFVVTKYDILNGFSLKTVQEILMESRQFRKFVELRRQFALPTHLIGVSAIGDNFADCDPHTGLMTKRKGAQAQPYNLDIILSFSVTDTLLTAFKQRATPSVISSRVFGALRFTAGAMEKVLGAAKFVDLADFFFLASLQKAARKARLRAGEWQKSIDASVANVKNANDAVDAIQSKQQRSIADYTCNHPACDLLREAEA